VKARKIVLIAHNVRSAHNVGSLLRTADGLGIAHVYLSGYTSYPSRANDERLPHLAAKTDHQIAKTALGAEKNVDWSHRPDIDELINELKTEDFEIAALEQSPLAINLADYKPSPKVALIVGNEVEGISSDVLDMSSEVIQIPMSGQKESFNVSVAAAIALYSLATKT